MKKSPKHDFYRIFVRAITLWKHFCSTKKQKNWKRVFTLPRAHQNRVFSEMFQVLALDTRPKWWFSFFLKSEIALPRTRQNIDFSKKFQESYIFQFFVLSGRKHTEQTMFDFSFFLNSWDFPGLLIKFQDFWTGSKV